MVHEKVESIEAVWQEDKSIKIIINPKNTKAKKITLVRTPSSIEGKISFQTKLPGEKTKYDYEGIIEGNKLYIYPIIGEGVLSTEPINIK